ncbi:Hpt domain-containing protein [Edaphobacter paludis]|uniref:Hpt domain-containing protein n=1 Tax=Edaphobacter paludis TaxID=3035702 RepID=A0AAU7DDM4_9BACT
MTPEEEAKIDVLLRSMWERHLPTLYERLDLLDRAASEAASGTMSETLRAQAFEVAHKLSGSLGMFGYHHGTEIARQMEQILKTLTSDSHSDLTSLTTELRQTLLGK